METLAKSRRKKMTKKMSELDRLPWLFLDLPREPPVGCKSELRPRLNRIWIRRRRWAKGGELVL